MAANNLLFTYDLFKTDHLNERTIWLRMSPFDVEVKSANLDTFLKDQFIEVTFDFEIKSILIFIGIEWKNDKTVPNYSKICTTVEFTLLAFQSLYTVISGFSHAHYLLRKPEITLNKERGDLQLKLTHRQPNIYDLLFAH